MTLPRKNTRTLVVDGFPYRWLAKYESVHWVEGYCCPLSLFVERADVRGQLLVSHFWCHRELVVYPQKQAITPRLVRRMLDAALARGWQPARQGLPPFELEGKEFFPNPADPLFSADALAVFDRLPYDPEARSFYNLFVRGLQWSDEFQVDDPVDFQRISDYRAAQLLIYRASLALGEEVSELRPLWEQLIQGAPPLARPPRRTARRESPQTPPGGTAR